MTPGGSPKQLATAAGGAAHSDIAVEDARGVGHGAVGLVGHGRQAAQPQPPDMSLRAVAEQRGDGEAEGAGRGVDRRGRRMQGDGVVGPGAVVAAASRRSA